MTLLYKGWCLAKPTITTLADGTGYTIFNIDIFKQVGGFTETRPLWREGVFPTKIAATVAAIEHARQIIDNF
jgi:hypothetical protein